MQLINACFEFQWFIPSNHIMTKTASNVSYVVKVAIKTRKARPAAKRQGNDNPLTCRERVTVMGASSVRLHFNMQNRKCDS